MQERFAPQITEIEPNKLEKRQISFTQKLKMMYLVNPTLAAIILAGGLGLAALGIADDRVYATHPEQPICTGTYLTDTDNVGQGGVGPADGDMDAHMRNDETNHPIEFNINIPQVGIYILTIKAHGVNTGVPDKVYIDSQYVMNLMGNDSSWSDTSSSPLNLNAGNRLAEVRIDESGGNDLIVVGCGILNPQSVGGIAAAPDIAYRGNLQNPDSGNGIGKYVALGAGAAGALALGGAGYGALKRRK